MSEMNGFQGGKKSYYFLIYYVKPKKMEKNENFTKKIISLSFHIVDKPAISC